MRAPQRAQKLIFLVSIFSAFLIFYLKVLLLGHMTDFPGHIILTHYSYLDRINTPHFVFGMILKVVTNLMGFLHLDALPELMNISTKGMMALYVQQLNIMSVSTGADLLAEPKITYSMLINYHLASAFLMASLIAFNAFIIFRLQRIVFARVKISSFLEYTGVVLALFVSPVYLPFFNANLYIGQGSPNVWHSPTYILMKSSVYLTVILFVPVLSRCVTSKGSLALASMALAASVLIKPSFAIVFLPTVFLFSAARKFKTIGTHLSLLLISVPAVVVLVSQYLVSYSNTNSSGIAFMPLYVWRLYSPSIPVSMLLALFFPIIVALLWLRRDISAGWYDWLACLMVVVSASQCLLFAESGARMRDFNFMWGYNISLDLLFIFSIAAFIKWASRTEHEQGVRFALRDWTSQSILALGCVALIAHSVSGVFYVLRIFMGGSYY